MSRYIAATLLGALVVMGGACGDEPTHPDVRVAQVEVLPAGGSVQVQQTLQLHAVAKSASGDALPGKAIAWSSSDEAFATVSAAGLVTGVAAGTVAISAASEGRSAAVQLEVTEQPAPPPPPPPLGNPVPEIESVSPSVVLLGSYEATITVRGKNFIAGSMGFLGSTRPTDFVSSTELRVTLYGEDLGAVGTRQIRVFNPAPGGGMSNAVDVVIEARGPKVVITPGVVELAVGDTLRVRARLYDEWGIEVPGTGQRRINWRRLDLGVQVESYDAVRDSIRVRALATGTHRIVTSTLDGLFADTLVITGKAN